jgi:UDP-3-O-[3-hydroxymyristoyl] glucosamine N-acyltransferase
MVTRPFTEPGSYRNGIPVMPGSQWRRNAVRLRHLDLLARRLKQLEERVAALGGTPGQEDN